VAHQNKKVPSTVEMRWPCLRWAMGHRGGYTGFDRKLHLLEHFDLADEVLDEVGANGYPLFDNYVDWVTAHFTETGIHTSIDGRPHKNRDDPCDLTRYGYAVAEGKAEWPTEKRHGPRNALPDPRQLPEPEG